MNARNHPGTDLPPAAREQVAVPRLPVSEGLGSVSLDLIGLARLTYRIDASVPSVTLELNVAGTVVWQGEIVGATVSLPDPPPTARLVPLRAGQSYPGKAKDAEACPARTPLAVRGAA